MSLYPQNGISIFPHFSHFPLFPQKNGIHFFIKKTLKYKRLFLYFLKSIYFLELYLRIFQFRFFVEKVENEKNEKIVEKKKIPFFIFYIK